MTPRLIIEQKITALVNKYAVYSVAADGSKGEMIALAQQKRLAFKEKVIFYTDTTKTTPVFSFRAEKVMDVHGKYFVEDPSGVAIGAFKKEFKKSLLNSTWNILDTNGNAALVISESSQTIAVMRRFVGWVPIIGELLEFITGFIKYHFTFKNVNGDEVGMYKKTTLFRDHYVLSIDDATYTAQDWRVLAAMAVALDALQSR